MRRWTRDRPSSRCRLWPSLPRALVRRTQPARRRTSSATAKRPSEPAGETSSTTRSTPSTLPWTTRSTRSDGSTRSLATCSIARRSSMAGPVDLARSHRWWWRRWDPRGGPPVGDGPRVDTGLPDHGGPRRRPRTDPRRPPDPRPSRGRRSRRHRDRSPPTRDRHASGDRLRRPPWRASREASRSSSRSSDSPSRSSRSRIASIGTTRGSRSRRSSRTSWSSHDPPSRARGLSADPAELLSITERARYLFGLRLGLAGVVIVSRPGIATARRRSRSRPRPPSSSRSRCSPPRSSGRRTSRGAGAAGSRCSWTASTSPP